MSKKRNTHRLKVLSGRKAEGKIEYKPPPVRGRWNCPSWLGEYGCEFHKRYFPHVEKMGLITEADRESWFFTCQRVHRIRQYESEIDRVGALIRGRQNSLVKNPLLPALKAELEHFSKMCRKFGLDPEARELLGFKYESKATGITEDMID
jgi:P27 family predicted phage terminase small subunit